MDDILGILYRFTLGKMGFAVEILICEILFSHTLKLRIWFRKWISCVVIVLLICAHLTIGYYMPLSKVPGLSTLGVFGISVVFQLIIFDVSLNRILFNSVAAYTVQNLAVNIRSFLLSLLSLTPWTRFAGQVLLTAAVYIAVYFLLVRKVAHKKSCLGYVHLYIMSFVSVLVTNTLFAILRRGGMLNEYTYVILAICCLLALLYQFSSFKRANLDEEIVTIEKLLYYEQKQHNLSQETIDLINLKCHDLKKQVTALRELLGDRADEVLGETEKAITVYENMVNTGNKNLDLVILEEKNYCGKYGVSIDVMADGEQLDFMAPADIYSLFSNALNNAIESVMDEEEAHRQIRMKVHRNGEYVCIEIVNYCSRTLEFKNGRPVTSKGDLKFHGYGIRSMEYIVDKYGGNMVINFEKKMFTVKIIIKKPS